MKRVARAVEAVDERLRESAAGWIDMSYAMFGASDGSEWDANPVHGLRYQTRLKHTLLSISHLRDDCARLAKATGKPHSLLATSIRGSIVLNGKSGWL